MSLFDLFRTTPKPNLNEQEWGGLLSAALVTIKRTAAEIDTSDMDEAKGALRVAVEELESIGRLAGDADAPRPLQGCHREFVAFVRSASATFATLGLQVYASQAFASSGYNDRRSFDEMRRAEQRMPSVAASQERAAKAFLINFRRACALSPSLHADLQLATEAGDALAELLRDTV